MALTSKKRAPFDKLIKQVLEQFREEFALLKEVAAQQQTILAQNEKNTEFLRQIWNRLERGESSDRTTGPG